MKCLSCMIGKGTLEGLPTLKDRATESLFQVKMDWFSSSVTSIVDWRVQLCSCVCYCYCRYRWVYGMKLKSDMLKVVKKWFSDIAVIKQKHKLVIVMRDNAGENKSQEIIDFFESVGVKLFQHCTWAMAEWTCQSSNQFYHDGRKDNHGGIWTGLLILVQGSIGCMWCLQCDLQGAHRH